MAAVLNKISNGAASEFKMISNGTETVSVKSERLHEGFGMEAKKFSVKLNFRAKKSIPFYLLTIFYIFISVIYIRQEPFSGERVINTIVLFLLWTLITLLSVLEISGVRAFCQKHTRLTNAFALLLAPLASFLMVEVMVSNFNLKMFQAYSLYNIIWYIILYYLIYALTRNSRITVTCGILLMYIAGMVNYFVYLFRGNPILPSDLLAWRTGMSVASNYELRFSQGFLIATVIMYAMFLLGCKLSKVEKSPSLVNRFIVCGFYVIFAFFVFHAFFDTDLINKKIRVLDFFAPKYTYIDYGTAFGFVANVKAMETEVPAGYSTQKVEQALTSAEADAEGTEVSEDKPNIIVIMNEAFSDLSLLGDYETSMDYLPFIRSLSENSIKGVMYSSVFGGATSDTEYEFLTGNSMAVLPKNCVPYQQYVLDSTDSLATTLKAQGYYNIAIHPYKGSGYKRDLVYPLLGFDEFLTLDNFISPELIRSYVSDRESFKKIIEEYENKEKDGPLFIFNVTMQNHGGYSSEQLFSDNETVRLTDNPGHGTVEQYLSLLRKSDEAFQTLVDYFSAQDKHTIILMYGDHQPIAYSSLYDDMQDQEKENELKYKVPFVLWANYDIREDNVDEISANYLSSYLLRTAGLQGTAYNDYLMELYQEIPVINASFYIDKNDTIHNYSETSEYSELVTEYKYVGYNDALDKQGKLKEFFRLK
jgi:phosphoglycerol transferase MdoB-like AlkP superfamily enzyme